MDVIGLLSPTNMDNSLRLQNELTAKGYSALAVANHFLDLAKIEGIPISPLKLQKLVYLSHGWYLGINESPLIEDEYAEAWQFGPVFPSLYQEFKKFVNKPITVAATEIGETTSGFVLVTPSIDLRDRSAVRVIERVWWIYKGYSANQLSNITHKKGSPWDDTVKNEPNKKNRNISDAVIMRYYRDKLDKKRNS